MYFLFGKSFNDTKSLGLELHQYRLCSCFQVLLRSVQINTQLFRSMQCYKDDGVSTWKASSIQWIPPKTCFSSIVLSIAIKWLIALALMCLTFSHSKHCNFSSLCARAHFHQFAISLRVNSIRRWKCFFHSCSILENTITVADVPQIRKILLNRAGTWAFFDEKQRLKRPKEREKIGIKRGETNDLKKTKRIIDLGKKAANRGVSLELSHF